MNVITRLGTSSTAMPSLQRQDYSHAGASMAPKKNGHVPKPLPKHGPVVFLYELSAETWVSNDGNLGGAEKQLNAVLNPLLPL